MRTLPLLLVLTATAASAQSPCARLTALTLDHAIVTTAAVLPAATDIPGAKLTPARIPALPAFCRVQITGKPSPDSDIKTEIWLPLEHWNGRYYGQGNGGFAGQIAYEQMAAALAAGYATSGTNTGHPNVTGDFALGHPEKVKDFGWRAIHETAVEAKAVATAFYASPPQHSYFVSCSDGGREALMEAQRFPSDYDGIVAGAPAYYWTKLVATGAVDEQNLLATPASYIPARKLPAISEAVRNACDAQDGLKDGIIADPRRCTFDPATLACKAGDSDSCLLPEQIATLKQIYGPKLDSQGKQVYPGYLPGGEDYPGSWVPWKVGPDPSAQPLMLFFANGYFQDFVHQDPTWSLKSFNLDKDLALAESTTAEALNATDPNLKPFFNRGGKLILYHGWNDPAIPALGTIDYYTAVQNSTGAQATEKSSRLYMVPGMLHCLYGPGANSFGQLGLASRTDAQHDIVTALEQWVETGKAPDRLTATKYTADDPAKPVALTRPLCPYPQEPHYLPGKDATQASSFTCALPQP